MYTLSKFRRNRCSDLLHVSQIPVFDDVFEALLKEVAAEKNDESGVQWSSSRITNREK